MEQQVGIKKWDILENILIEKLVFWGKWFARLISLNLSSSNVGGINNSSC